MYLATYTPPLTLDEDSEREDEQLTVKLLSQKVSDAERVSGVQVDLKSHFLSKHTHSLQTEFLKQAETLLGLSHAHVV